MVIIRMKSTIRTYSELVQIPTYEERLAYLRLRGTVGEDTFGFDRIFNQMFYRGGEWRRTRNGIIVRDDGCDLACRDRPIVNDIADDRRRKPSIIIHHMNPIDLDDIRNVTEYLMDPEYLICTSLGTHNAIHYGHEKPFAPREFVERIPGDTCPWKK